MRVLITRRRWACYFVPAVVASAVGAFVAWYVGADRRILLSPVMMTGIWLAIAWQTPKEGHEWTPITFGNGQAQLLIWLSVWGALGLLGLALAPEPNSLSTHAILWTGFAVWFIVLTAVCYFLDCRSKVLGWAGTKGTDISDSLPSDLEPPDRV